MPVMVKKIVPNAESGGKCRKASAHSTETPTRNTSPSPRVNSMLRLNRPWSPYSAAASARNAVRLLSSSTTEMPSPSSWFKSSGRSTPRRKYRLDSSAANRKLSEMMKTHSPSRFMPTPPWPGSAGAASS